MFAAPLTEDAELRPLEPWRAAEFLAHVEKARDHIAPYISWATTMNDEESARAFLQRYADAAAADSGYLYGIWRSGALVGGVLFRVFDARTGTCELGVWLAPDAIGHGLVGRASQRLIDWAIGERGLHRVEWRCAPENAPSAAVAKRLGMILEGTLRQAYSNNGVLMDSQVWSLLRAEWEHRAWA